ncbi:hypothetical protein AVEN_199170-1 [Araneus ventricosus]|uniref:Uncharacterized protein n=1 Tax=Araneus ventricosus TaxID=182803 RepID=A0A4Y2PKD7_ARAVE|nr:hypothetical protein AVEN_199170-1 [Araneus ventricosus]
MAFMTNVNEKKMECLLIVWMHINRDALSTGRTLPRKKLGLVIPSIMVASPGPSFCPHKFYQNSLGVRSPLLLKSPNQKKKKRPPPSLKFSPRKKTKTPSVLLLRPASLRHRQLRHFPLERSPKFRTGPDISSAHSKISSSTGIFSSA